MCQNEKFKQEKPSVKLCAARPEDSVTISEMADLIFHEVYRDVPSDVLEGFLQEYQAPEKIREQIGTGMNYAFILAEGERAGYISYGLDEMGMYLSKLYLDTADTLAWTVWIVTLALLMEWLLKRITERGKNNDRDS